MTIDKAKFEAVLSQLTLTENSVIALENSAYNADASHPFETEFTGVHQTLEDVRIWTNQKILEADQETVMNGFLSELKVVFDKYSAKLEVGSSTEGYGVDYGNASPDGGVRLSATLDGVTSTKEINKAVIVGEDLT